MLRPARDKINLGKLNKGKLKDHVNSGIYKLNFYDRTSLSSHHIVMVTPIHFPPDLA